MVPDYGGFLESSRIFAFISWDVPIYIYIYIYISGYLIITIFNYIKPAWLTEGIETDAPGSALIEG